MDEMGETMSPKEKVRDLFSGATEYDGLCDALTADNSCQAKPHDHGRFVHPYALQMATTSAR